MKFLNQIRLRRRGELLESVREERLKFIGFEWLTIFVKWLILEKD